MNQTKFINATITKYKKLNKLADTFGTVIFGDQEDLEIPLCELKQAFQLNQNFYNRSFPNLSILDSAKIYEECIEPLCPKVLLLHIGSNDLELLERDIEAFSYAYTNLINTIKKTNSTCQIVLISQQNPKEDLAISNLNLSLKNIAQSYNLVFEDISKNRLWNPKETKEVLSFIYSMGFVRPLQRQKSFYDLVKILFCYQ